MHEYSLMERVIESIFENMAKEKVSGAVAEVILQVGVLEVHSVEAGRLAFEVLTRGTPLENARLRLVIMPAMFQCPGCGFSQNYSLDHDVGHEPLPPVACPRCGSPAVITGGRGVESIELVLS